MSRTQERKQKTTKWFKWNHSLEFDSRNMISRREMEMESLFLRSKKDHFSHDAIKLQRWDLFLDVVFH